MKASQRLAVSYSERTYAATFKADPELWSRFKTTCKLRGVSICHVLEALMEAWIQAQKVQATLIQPVHIDLHMEHIVQRPRRMIDSWAPKRPLWPPSCEDADDFIRSTQEVGCLARKEFVRLEDCWRCFRERSSR